MSLLDLLPQSRTVELAGGRVEVHPARIRDLLAILARHRASAASLQEAMRSDEPGALRDAVVRLGAGFVDDVLDVATRSDPGTAARATLTAGDELEIVGTFIDLTLPKEQLGNALARFDRMEAAVGSGGKNGSKPGSTPSTSSANTAPTPTPST